MEFYVKGRINNIHSQALIQILIVIEIKFLKLG